MQRGKQRVLSLALVLLASLFFGRALAAQDGEKLDVRPRFPTSEEPVQVLVHGDEFGDFCGNILAISPITPDTTIIDVWYVPLSFDIACPSAVFHVTKTLPLGTLSPGRYTVKLWGPASPWGGAWLWEAVSFTVSGGPSEKLSLHGGRFEARVTWNSFDGSSGVAKVVPGSSPEGGLFWFFGRNNWELLLKVLDGCELNGHYWVLGAGATNVGFTIEIVDTVTQETWTYTNPLGRSAGSIFDTRALSNACPP